MNLRAIPLIFVILLGPMKLFFLATRRDAFDIFAWILFSAACLWVCWAYWKNRDIPAYSGNFKFQDGRNELPRVAFTLLMTAVYFIGAIKG